MYTDIIFLCDGRTETSPVDGINVIVTDSLTNGLAIFLANSYHNISEQFIVVGGTGSSPGSNYHIYITPNITGATIRADVSNRKCAVYAR